MKRQLTSLYLFFCVGQSALAISKSLNCQDSLSYGQISEDLSPPPYDGAYGYARRAVDFGRAHLGNRTLISELRIKEAQSLRAWRRSSQGMWEALSTPEGRQSVAFRNAFGEASFYENEGSYYRQMREAAQGLWGSAEHPVDP